MWHPVRPQPSSVCCLFFVLGASLLREILFHFGGLYSAQLDWLCYSTLEVVARRTSTSMADVGSLQKLIARAQKHDKVWAVRVPVNSKVKI